MPAVQLKCQIEMEDGQRYTVTGDQRDIAHFEIQDFYSPIAKNTMIRFVAWSAAYRQKRTKLDWEDFNAQCVEVADPDDEDTVLDPTSPAPTAGNSRT